MAQKLEKKMEYNWLNSFVRGGSNLQTFLMLRPFCLWTFKKLCLCTANLDLSTRLAVHKKSFLNLLTQNSRRVTKVC